MHDKLDQHSGKIECSARVPEELSGQRLDKVLALLWPEHSRAQYQHWIRAGAVTVNGQIQRETKIKVLSPAEIRLSATREKQTDWAPEAIHLDIIYEDEFLLVVNKPAGLVVHPGAGNPAHTLVNALLHHAPALAQVPRAGIIHRLDKDTSGLLLIAKTLSAHHQLSSALKARDIKREYLAIVKGVVKQAGQINAPIGRHVSQRTKMAIRPHGGRHAVTHFTPTEHFAHFTLLHVQLETGRTHQIRVHMEYVKHPIVGDPSYGRGLNFSHTLSPELSEGLNAFKRQALHAWRLSFIHPETQQLLSLNAPPPNDFSTILNLLRDHDSPNRNT